MPINQFMQAALKALSYTTDVDLKKNYKLDRLVHSMTHPAIKALYKIHDDTVMSPDGAIPIRLFYPEHTDSDDLILFFHGGGWVSGNIDTYAQTCARTAELTKRRVISVEYRRAPEYPFPCAVDDCYHVTKALCSPGNQWGTRPERLILMGDSAGGNLAAAVSLKGTDTNEFSIGKQILLYPSVYHDHTESSPFASIVENGTDYLLTSKKICDYMALYVRDPKDLTNPYFAPLLSDNLYHQPDTLIVTAQYDPLRDEGEAFGDKLKQFGNRVQVVRMADALHGFFTLPILFSHVQKCYEIIIAFINQERSHEIQLEPIG